MKTNQKRISTKTAINFVSQLSYLNNKVRPLINFCSYYKDVRVVVNIGKPRNFLKGNMYFTYIVSYTDYVCLTEYPAFLFLIGEIE